MIRCKLSVLLGERRMKMSELARASGLSYPAVNAIYHEQTKVIAYDTLNKLCKALDCNVQDILEYIPDEAQPDE